MLPIGGDDCLPKNGLIPAFFREIDVAFHKLGLVMGSEVAFMLEAEAITFAGGAETGKCDCLRRRDSDFRPAGSFEQCCSLALHNSEKNRKRVQTLNSPMHTSSQAMLRLINAKPEKVSTQHTDTENHTPQVDQQDVLRKQL